MLYYAPCIPGNSGAAIRLSACTGSMLHLIEPLGFVMDDTRLKRAGLDYHDLAHVKVHPNLDEAVAEIEGSLYAFTGHATTWHTDVSYRDGDGLLFGPEPTGLPAEVLADARITEQVRIPMTPQRRSLNLTIAASIATYEALRQCGFPGLT
nr:tRNA (cytidine(34)-2'-O)-methyltransferase [Nanchangia anserum]